MLTRPPFACAIVDAPRAIVDTPRALVDTPRALVHAPPAIADGRSRCDRAA